MIKKLLGNEKLMKIVRYVFIGGCTTLVNFALFWFLKDICGIEMNLANTIAVVCSVIFAYITNKIFVFRSRTDSFSALMREMLTFFSGRAVTMLLDIGIVFLVHTVLSVDEKYSMITKVLVNILVLILNYIISQRFVFGRKSKETQ